MTFGRNMPPPSPVRAAPQARMCPPSQHGRPTRGHSETSPGSLFAGNFRESLLFNRAVLRQPIDLSAPDPEMLKTKREVALATQTAAVRIRPRCQLRHFDTTASLIGSCSGSPLCAAASV